MFGSILDLLAGFVLWIQENDGSGDFSNFDVVFGLFGDLAGSLDDIMGS